VLVREGSFSVPRPEWRGLGRLGRVVAAHSWLNFSVFAPRMLMPVLVTVVISARANASFYAAWLIVSFLYLVPSHLCTVLFAIGAADLERAAEKTRFTLKTSLLLGVVGVGVCIAAAPVGLRLFGAEYASDAAVALQLLALGYFPTTLKVHYSAIARIRGTMGRAASLLTVGAVLEVIGAVVGGSVGGLNGLALGLVAAMVAEGLMVGRTVFWATSVAGWQRSAGKSAADAQEG
jgi:O-antigen/teichoic acid export membrane protein